MKEVSVQADFRDGNNSAANVEHAGRECGKNPDLGLPRPSQLNFSRNQLRNRALILPPTQVISRPPGVAPSGDGQRPRAVRGSDARSRFAAFDHLVDGLHARVLSSRRRPRSLPDRRRTQRRRRQRQRTRDAGARSKVAARRSDQSRSTAATAGRSGRRQYMSRPNGMQGRPLAQEAARLDRAARLGSRACRGGRTARSSSTPRRRSNWRCCNSREYQTALERLYLAALALTLNRFEFQYPLVLDQPDRIVQHCARIRQLRPNTLTSTSNSDSAQRSRPAGNSSSTSPTASCSNTRATAARASAAPSSSTSCSRSCGTPAAACASSN